MRSEIEVIQLEKRIEELEEENHDRADTEASLVKQLVTAVDRMKELEALIKKTYGYFYLNWVAGPDLKERLRKIAEGDADE